MERRKFVLSFVSRPKWTQSLKNSILKVGTNEGVIYTEISNT